MTDEWNAVYFPAVLLQSTCVHRIIKDVESKCSRMLDKKILKKVDNICHVTKRWSIYDHFFGVLGLKSNLIYWILFEILP